MAMTSSNLPEESSLGSRFRRWRDRRTSSLDANGGSSLSLTSTNDVSATSKEELDYEKLAMSEPQVVSLTFFLPPVGVQSSSLQGFVLAVDSPQGDIVIADFLAHEDSFLLPILQLHVHSGDVLESINGKPCRGCPLDDILQTLSGATGLVTLVLRRKSTVQLEYEIRHALFITSNDVLMPIGISFKKQEDLLMIDSVDAEDSWTSESCLRTGQVVLSINENPSQELEVQDAHLFLKFKMDSAPCVSITTLSRDTTRTRASKVRKAAVAVGGSAMVGVGAVIMATPLHPIGHAMAFGGLGVLGTEFEGPRKVIQQARNSLRSASNKMNGTSSHQMSSDDGNTLQNEDSIASLTSLSTNSSDSG